MKKIAFVVQRYGLEVNGGAELLARLLAERMVPYYDVEVLTTCAVDYTTWENHYLEGESEINDVKVVRFPVDFPRDVERFSEINTKLLTIDKGNLNTEQEWIDEQGPYSTKLIQYIEDNKEEYNVFIFVTYLYYQTVRGIGLVCEKAILIPNAHDEEPIYFNVFKDVFQCPRAIAYNTEEERDFVHKLFNNKNIPDDVVGVGVDIPENPDPALFRAKYGIDDYIMYAGRIDVGKNSHELFKYFIEYKKRNPSDLKLVLIGKEFIKVPEHPDIISLGFVSDEDRINAMAGAKIFVLPSIYESLSMVVLESMASGVPVVVNGECDVVKGHCIKSNAGLYYDGYLEFEGCINYLINNYDVYSIMSYNAKRYIEENYRWDVVTDKLKRIIQGVIETKQ